MFETSDDLGKFDPKSLVLFVWCRSLGMQLLSVSKDGGDESRVWAYWLIEWKGLFSIALLRFEDGSREAYHEHAFNSVSWILRGALEERHLGGGVEHHRASLCPVWTYRETFHQVFSRGRTWVLSFRGPWAARWREYIPGEGMVTLTHGRRVL